MRTHRESAPGDPRGGADACALAARGRGDAPLERHSWGERRRRAEEGGLIARRPVSRVALDEWLTAEIRKVAGCENCALASKYVVGEPKKNNGCNWAGLTIRMGEGAVVQVVAQAAAVIEQQASLRFNLDTVAPRLQVERLAVQMARRLLYTPVFRLDAGLVHARRRPCEVDQLETWWKHGVILLDMPGVAHDDAQEARAGRRLLVAGEDVIFVKASDDGPSDAMRTVRDSIESRATPVAGDGSSRSCSRGIPDRRGDPRQLGANVMSAPEAVAHVRRQIAKRDAVNVEIAEATGQALPDWTGRD